MSRVDRIARIAVALFVAILLLSGALTGAVGVVLGIIAAILLITGIVGTCPLYLILKVSTNKKA
jgi:hypothetical protein